MINSSVVSPAMTVCRSIVMDRGFMFLSLFFGLIITFSAQGLAQDDLVIYTDALGTNWFNWIFDQVDYENTNPTHSGNRSISVRAHAGEGIVFVHDPALNTSRYSDLSFWIHGGTEGGQRLYVVSVLNQQGYVFVLLDPLEPDQWQQIIIPLADLGVADQMGVNGFAVGNFAEADQSTFYLDDISLIAKWVDPNKVAFPRPINGWNNVPVTVELSWQAPSAYTPTSYDVYFGTEADPYNNPKYTVDTNSFDPSGDLDSWTTYTWVVDANHNGIIYPGEPWSFTTMLVIEGLRIDFTRQGGPVTPGWEGYFAQHERLSSFTTQSYSAFDTTVNVTPSWQANADDTAAQMYDRGGDDGTNAEDFLRDWIGTDARVSGDPMTLTIAGLPPGSYIWRSYHHDTEDQTGLFDVTVNDATGSVTTTDVDISSSWYDGIYDLTNVTVFITTIASNGTDPVTLTFDCQNSSGDVSTVFFLMNGFELGLTERESDRVFGPVPANGAENVSLTADFFWQAPTTFTPTAYEVYFGTAANPYDNPKTTVYANQYDPPQDLAYGTMYTWIVDALDNDTVYPGTPWHFTTMLNRATNPLPADGATEISVTTTLSWTPATSVTSQDLYFGTEPNAYDNPQYTVDTNSFVPTDYLAFGTTYTWVVDTHDNGILYPGEPWSFTTRAPIEPNGWVAGNMMLINDNGNWCWYQDDKIIYDPVGGNILTSTAAQGSGFGGVGGSRTNDMDATTFNIATGKRTRVVAREGGGGDDHNMGAFWVRPDGRYLHMYCMHYNNQDTFYRVSTDPYDSSSWGSEQSYNWEDISGLSDTMTSSYTNVHYVSGEGTGSGRLYNIIRVFERTPCISYSDDSGVTWNYMGRLNGITGTTTYSNFYHKFRSNGVDRIDFIGCEQHPRNYTNSIYHGYIMNGISYDSYGNQVDVINDQDAPPIGAFTTVWATGPVAEGEYHTGWTNEIELDENGYPVCLFQTRYGTDPYGGALGAADHRFFYGRFNGSEWISTELCKMGPGLHGPEQDYLGMGCIHPDDANTIYVSTPFDPRDDTPLTHHEIFKGVTTDNGLTWEWTPITMNSTEDNLRPAVPSWDADHTAVFWVRGVYPGQERYDTVIVGMIDDPNETLGLVTYVDANETNTTLADGSVFAATGPDAYYGDADDQWHEYTAYGNSGNVYTAGAGTEDAPMLKTTITGLTDGTYDVFAFFWSDPTADWGVVGGFEPTDMLYFSKQSSQQAEASQFTGAVDVIDIETAMYRVYIGRTEIRDDASVDVYIDDYDDSFVNAPVLTTYDGVGAARVIPDYVGDIYRDGVVDLKDIAELGRGWLTIYNIYTLADVADNWLAGI